MKKFYALLTFLIIVGIFIPAVSAEELINEDLVNYVDTSISFSQDGVSYSGVNLRNYDTIYIKKIENQKNLKYFALSVKSEAGKASNFMTEGRHEITYTVGGITDTCIVYCQYSKNILGSIDYATYLIFPQNWNVGTKTGKQYIVFSEPLLKNDKEGIRIYHYNNGVKTDKRNDYDIGLVSNSVGTYTTQVHLAGNIHTISATSAQEWRNNLLVETGISDLTRVVVTREYDGQGYESIISLVDNGTTVFQNGDVKDFEQFFPTTTPFDTIVLTDNVGKDYTYYIDNSVAPSSPDVVTVYIKNSQTGALIANSNIVIDALVNGEYHPVVNRTEPSGIFSINLQPTGGGQPNPDSYRLIVTADGYNNPMPEINFTVDDSKNYIYCLLDPIAGGPVNENKTFIDFFVRDMSANPVSGATVKFGKYTLITNSAGYTVFEVDKNNNYSWTVSKSGYGSLTGNAVIGDAPRHTINTGIDPVVTPTKPTPISTSTPISPTPTMTAPTGESVSNWLEWFAAHFGMILGGGVEIGKIFMWLCFTVPVGVYVGKEAKAGAAGFMAGAGIVTLFFVLIGWVPIWLLVLLALIIGLLYAKEFNTADNGGGR